MNEEKKEMQKAAVKKIVAKVDKEQMIYIGPSIKYVVATGTVLSNGLPQKLKDETERIPELDNLVIPVSKLAEAQRELNKVGSALSIIYKQVEERQENK